MPDDKLIEVELCMGSACFARGNRNTVDALTRFVAENGLEKQVSLKGCLCKGSCKHGPHVSINQCGCKNVKTEDVLDRISQLTGKKIQK